MHLCVSEINVTAITDKDNHCTRQSCELKNGGKT